MSEANMKTKQAILAVLKGAPSPRVNQVGQLWQIGFAWVSGARKDGVGLAVDLMAKWKREGGVPEPEPAPFIDYHMDRDGAKAPGSDVPEEDWKMLYEELRKQMHTAEPVKVEIPAFLTAPPADVTDVLAEVGTSMFDTYERVNELLVAKLREAKGSAELARTYGGSFNGKSVVEWERKSQSINESIRWNSGRRVETI